MEKRKYSELKTQKQFMKLLMANLVSRFGDSLDVIAYSWIMYEVTGSESLMAFIMGLNYLPTVLLMPFIGAIVDRLPKKKVMYLADISRFLIVMSIVFLYSSGNLSVFALITATLLTSAVECFRIPASGAITPMILEEEYFKLGKGASYSSSRISELVGFALSGIVIATFGVKIALVIDAITFLISAILISFIKYNDVFKNEEITLEKLKKDYKEGIEYVKTSSGLKGVIAVGICVNFGSMTMASFLTVYVSEYLQMDAKVLSYIRICMALGLTLGAFITPKIKFVNSNLVSICSILMSSSIFLTGLIPSISSQISMISILLIFACMWCIGFTGGAINVVVGSVFMKASPQEKLGRVSAIVSSCMQVSLPTTSFICSALAIKLNAPTILMLLGSLVTILHIIVFLSKKLEPINI